MWLYAIGATTIRNHVFTFYLLLFMRRHNKKTSICVLNRTVNVHEWKINTHFKYHIWCLLQIWYIFMEHCIIYGTQYVYKSRISYCLLRPFTMYDYSVSGFCPLSGVPIKMHFQQMDLFQLWGTKGRDVPTQVASTERVILSHWIQNNKRTALSTKSN